MNGIIHPCSHPNDDDPHFRITEEQIFRNIFNYIEVKVFITQCITTLVKLTMMQGREWILYALLQLLQVS